MGDRSVADATRMRAALAEVLTDPVFARSPTLARLAEYLVEATIRGHGHSLKSYSVAVDGLGRSPDFDPQADSYARVLVGRLRKALDTHYAGTGAQQSLRLRIESGSYEVFLVPNGRAEQTLPEPLQPSRFRPDRRLIGVVLALCLASAVAAFMLWRTDSQAATQRWRTSNSPWVDVRVYDGPDGEVQTDLARRMRQSIIMALANYEGIRVSFSPSKKAQYSIEVDLIIEGRKYIESISVIDITTNRIIWSDSGKMHYQKNGYDISTDEFMSGSIFRITHLSGIIHSHERKRNYAVNTPYGCWLQFSAMLDNNHAIGDTSLTDCARDWYRSAPNHPLAAALHGWALTDKSVSRLTESARAEDIANAIAVVEAARAMNPNSPTLQVTAMRAYAFAGDSAAVRLAANQALKLNPQNLDIQGAAGMMLALQNDPAGEALLERAIAKHFNPPPWYFVGTFASAMMRDDPVGAGRSLVRLRTFQHSLPILPILSAAYEARIGHVDQARSEWNRAKAKQPVLGIMPDRFLSRLPMAEPVRRRLEQWLAPVLGKRSGR